MLTLLIMDRRNLTPCLRVVLQDISSNIQVSSRKQEQPRFGSCWRSVRRIYLL